MERKEKLTGIFGSTVIILVIALLAMNINLNQPVVQTKSCSNYPILAPGNLIVVQNTDFENIEEGETVVYRVLSENLTVTHQVVSKSEKSLQTKGENNRKQLPFESSVNSSQIWGTSAFVIPIDSGSKCSSR